MVADAFPAKPRRWSAGFARRAGAAALLLLTATALAFVVLPAAILVGALGVLVLLQPHLPTSGHSTPGPAPSARPMTRASRIGTIVFLAVITIWVAYRYQFYLLLPLLLVEILHPALRLTWGTLDLLVDRIRSLLAPAKRLPSALIGLPLLFLGLFLGTFYESSVLWLAEGTRTVITGVANVAPYVIFFTLAPAIASTLVTGRAGKFALWVTSSYIILTLLAGILAVLVVVPAFGVRLSGGGAPGAAAVQSNLLQLLFTSNAFLAIFAAVGTALMIHGFRLPGLHAATSFFGRKAVDLAGDVLKILLPLILFALGSYIPTKLAEAIEGAQSQGAPEPSGWVGNYDIAAGYFIAVAVLVFILTIWSMGQAYLVMRYTKFPFSKFLRDYFLDVYAYGWATASSSATIPLNLERTGEALRVRQNVREFVIPLGATVHLAGTMIGGMVTTVVAAQLVGYTPTVLDLLYVLIPLMVVTVGAPGVPSGLAIVGGPVIVNLLPLPPGTQAAFTAIFIGFNIGLSDQFRTGVNATGDGVLSRLFEYWYPRKFSRSARQIPLETPAAPEEPVALPRKRTRKPARPSRATNT